MAIIVTYDVPTKHVDLKNALKSLGYAEQLKTTKCPTLYLPNTTLYHANKSTQAAVADVSNACRNLGTTLERCVATEWLNADFMCGKAF